MFTLQNAAGETVGFIGSIRDVSEREDRLTQLKNLDRVLRHNFNNEITVIEGFAEQIQAEGSGEILEHAERIRTASERLSETVSKERQITKILSERPSIGEVDISSVCRRATERVAADYPQAAISTEIPDGVRVRGTPHIEQAIEELLRNAIVHSETAPTVSLSVAPSEEVVSIVVTDTNRPIPAMEREVLLGENELTPLHHGSGMGLWLVKQVVKYADGMLDFQERDPQGNIVTITLPVRTDVTHTGN
ncbi:MAG: sensor histidine kinase [Halodesulfurarchaeum sp.]